MNKPLAAIAAFAGLVFLGSGAWMLAGHFRAQDSVLVEIVQDGKVLYTVDLASEEDRSFRIEGADSWNLVTVRGGEIFMEEAGCPDQTCVKMGVLRAENLPIVCLPNKLVIRFADSQEVS
ncbi:MAG: NusG domain II-containing protein [Oscillospiraceae bacterium]|nr:NusG domain II-containing protein [Oscillospiraceae bacterium]